MSISDRPYIFKLREDIIIKHNKGVVTEDFEQHIQLFSDEERKLISSMLSNKRIALEIVWFYQLLQDKLHVHHKKFSHPYKKHHWVKTIAKVNDRGYFRMPKELTKHWIDWRDIAIKKEYLVLSMDHEDTMDNQLAMLDMARGAEGGYRYHIQIGYPICNQLVPYMSHIDFTKYRRGMIKVPVPMSKLFNIKKGNKIVFMIYKGSDTEYYDKTRRYDAEASHDTSTPEDTDSEEPIEYSWLD